MGKLVRQPRLAEQTATRLRQRLLRSAEAGAKLPSVRQLSEALGVSVPTVRSAQTLLAQEGWLTIRHGSGVYVAERNPRWRIGILSELDLFDHRIGNYFRAVARAMKAHLEASGASPRLYVGNAVPGDAKSDAVTCPQFWDEAENGHLDGAVILDVPSSRDWQKRVRSCPIPVVGDMTTYYVNFDTAGIVNAAVHRLAEQGCRRLGLLAWNASEPFRQAMGQCGLAINNAWIRDDVNPGLRGAGWDEFHEVWSAPGEKPDGLVILDDLLFADAQLAMFEMGIQVPRDLRLAVQTNRGIALPARMPVTAFEVDPAEHAQAYADLLLKRLRGEPIINNCPLLSFRERRLPEESISEERLENTVKAQ